VKTTVNEDVASNTHRLTQSAKESIDRYVSSKRSELMSEIQSKFESVVDAIDENQHRIMKELNEMDKNVKQKHQPKSPTPSSPSSPLPMPDWNTFTDFLMESKQQLNDFTGRGKKNNDEKK
jgi:hypothetical protein